MATPKRRRRLLNLDVHEVSLVKQPANLRSFCFFKSRKGITRDGLNTLLDEMIPRIVALVEKGLDETRRDDIIQALTGAVHDTEVGEGVVLNADAREMLLRAVLDNVGDDPSPATIADATAAALTQYLAEEGLTVTPAELGRQLAQVVAEELAT